MATITLTANPATFGDGFMTVEYSGKNLARSTVWATNVKEAGVALDAFIAELRTTYKGGFSASAQWPHSTRKPRGWDSAWDSGILNKAIRPTTETADA